MSPQYFFHPAHELSDLVQHLLLPHRRGWGRSVAARILDEGELLLTGCVESYYHKQVAQETLRQVHGVSRIRNELVVDRTLAAAASNF